MELITPRLLLREFEERDFQVLRDLDRRPEMHTYERELPGEAGRETPWMNLSGTSEKSHAQPSN